MNRMYMLTGGIVMKTKLDSLAYLHHLLNENGDSNSNNYRLKKELMAEQAYYCELFIETRTI